MKAMLTDHGDDVTTDDEESIEDIISKVKRFEIDDKDTLNICN